MGIRSVKKEDVPRSNPNPLVDTGMTYTLLGKVMIYNLNKDEDETKVIQSKYRESVREALCGVKQRGEHKARIKFGGNV